MAYLEYIDDDEYERFKREARERREREKAAAASRVDDTWRKAQRSENAPDFALSGPRTSYEPAIAARGTSGGLTAGYDAPAYYEPTPRVSDADVAESAVRMGVDPWQVAQEQARQNRPGDEGIRQTLAAPVRFVGQNISKPIAGLGEEIGRLGWQGMERATDTGSGLATELLGGRPQEQYESLRGLSRSDIPDIAERQKRRREMGLAYMPVGEFLPMSASEVGTIARGLQAGLKAAPSEARAAAGIAGDSAKAIAPIARKAGRVLEDVATSPELRQLTPGGTLAEAIGGTKGTKRYYHGTGSAFESPEAGKFNPNGLYGPGYYLTDNPEVAGSYAERKAGVRDFVRDAIAGRETVLATRQAELDRDIGAGVEPNTLAFRRQLVEDAKVNLDEAYAMLEKPGQQVRIVNVPKGLKLLDADAKVPPTEVNQVIRYFEDAGQPIVAKDIKNNLASFSVVTGDRLYKAIDHFTSPNAIEGGVATPILQSIGYDGIRYQGGKRTPMRNAAGNPIEHEAIVIFPESLPKITNALSGKPMGVAPETVGAVGGAVQGASTVEESDSPEEAARKVMTSAAIGGLGIAGVMRGAKALPEAARRIVPKLGVEDVGRGLSDLDEALAAIRNAPTAEELVNLRKGTMSRYPPTSAEGKAILGAAQARFGQLSGELPANVPPETALPTQPSLPAATGAMSTAEENARAYIQVQYEAGRAPAIEDIADASGLSMARAKALRDEVAPIVPKSVSSLAATSSSAPPEATQATSGLGKRTLATPESSSGATLERSVVPESPSIGEELPPTDRTPTGPPEPPIKIGNTTIVPPQGGSPPIEVGAGKRNKPVFSQFWNRTRNVIESQGPEGKALGQDLQKTRDIAEQTAGKWTLEMPTVRGLSNAEFENFVDVTERKGQALNPRVGQAVKEWAKVRDDIYYAAQNAGMDVGHLEDYFPHRYDPAMFQGAKGDKAIEHLLQTGQAKDRSEAEMMLRYRNDVMRDRRSGNLEIPRITDLPGYEKTKDALFGYVEGSANRIAQVRVFGEKDAIALRKIAKIRADGYDADAVRHLFDIAVGAQKYGDYQNTISRNVRAYSTWTKLGLGALTNLSQPLNTATVTGGLRTLMATPKAVFSKEAKDFALEAGVTLDGALRALREGGGYAGLSGKFGAPGFNKVETFNRVLTAEAGRSYARDMATKAAKGSQTASAALRAMKLDPVAIAQRGGKLTRDEEIQAARNMVERTQFKVDPQDLPGWADSPAGKVVMQFRTFSYNQTAFVARELIQPALRGNVKPLIRFLVYGAPVGMAEVVLQDALRNRPQEEDPVQFVRQAYQRIGGLGVLGDVAAGLAPPNSKYLPGERYALGAAGLALGPTASTALEGVGSIPTALQGKGTAIERFLLKQVPIVGPTIKNTLLPYKPGGRGGSAKSPTKLVHPGLSTTPQTPRRLVHPGLGAE